MIQLTITIKNVPLRDNIPGEALDISATTKRTGPTTDRQEGFLAYINKTVKASVHTFATKSGVHREVITEYDNP